MLAARFGLGEYGIGLFARAGADGALAAPIAGRLADRDCENGATVAAMAIGFLATTWVVAAGALVALAVLAVLIDEAVQTNQVVSRRTSISVPPAFRGRVNVIYMTIQFIGGSAGSLLDAATSHLSGWNTTEAASIGIGLFLLGLFALEMWRPA